MQITTVGLYLAKNVFQVHGVNRHSKVELRNQLKRDQVAAFFAKLPACLIGMEACSSAHHWARKLQALGHIVRLMAPQFVREEQQERCGRRRGNMRGCRPTLHALRAYQEH
jgi:transposase